MGTGDILLGVTLQWTSIPSRGGVAILSVASCYRNRDKLWLCGSPWLVCDFTFYFTYARWEWYTYLDSVVTGYNFLEWCSTVTVLHNLRPSPLGHTALSPVADKELYGNTWLLFWNSPWLHWLVQGNTEYEWMLHQTPFAAPDLTWSCLQGKKACKDIMIFFLISEQNNIYLHLIFKTFLSILLFFKRTHALWSREIDRLQVNSESTQSRRYFISTLREQRVFHRVDKNHVYLREGSQFYIYKHN